MQTSARLVIIGAGIVGCSTAYHLAKLGWRDVLVIDQGPFPRTGGSTSHAPGGMFQTNPSKLMTELAHYSVHLYESLRWDDQPCAELVGGIELAETPERWADLKRKAGLGKSWGLENHLLTPEECKARIPILDQRKVLGGFFVPDDGVARAVNACSAMAREASADGAVTFEGNVTVQDIEVVDGRVRAVVTDQGRIACETVLCCAGIWGPRIGRMVGQSIPLMPMEHQYTKTEPLPELAEWAASEIAIPLLRAQDHASYYRQHFDSWGIGNYRHAPLPVEPDAILSPKDAPVMPSIRDWTPEHFEEAHQAAINLFPSIEGRALTYKINGMFSFTPDAQSLLGESQVARGFWVAEAVWVTHGGGVGKVMAEWLEAGEPQLDVHEADLHRFYPHHATSSFVRRRGKQNYLEVYDIIHPKQQMEEPRNLRTGPAHPRLVEQGAAFFETAGFERAQWCEANARLLNGRNLPGRDGWAARFWSPIEAAEALHTRENAALYDLSAFAIMEVSGPGALPFLQHMTTNQMDVKPGRVVYTNMLDRRGGIVCDLTVARLAADRFWVITGGGVGPHDFAWIHDHAPGDGSVRLEDVGGKWAVFGLWGPKARSILESVTEDDVSHQGLRYFHWKDITIGYVPARAVRVSYVGELGWEIYCPMELGLKLWDTLWEAGRPHDLIAAGMGAFDSLRLEKGYRGWGADMTPDDTPLEAGLDFIVRWDKGDFHGREALERQKEQGIAKRLCTLTFEDPDAIVLGKEPIFANGGERAVGYVTSANHGYSVGRTIALGWLPVEHSAQGSKLEVEYFGRRYAATVQPDVLFDPEMTRIRV